MYTTYQTKLVSTNRVIGAPSLFGSCGGGISFMTAAVKLCYTDLVGDDEGFLHK